MLRLVDVVCQGYHVSPPEVIGAPSRPGWSWRELLVAAQMVRRRWDEEARARELAQARAEARAAAERWASLEA